MIEAILGLVIFGIVVTLYIDYQADKRFKLLAEHLDPLIARVDQHLEDISGVLSNIDRHSDSIRKMTSTYLFPPGT
mgnify:CR=1 FL=1